MHEDVCEIAARRECYLGLLVVQFRSMTSVVVILCVWGFALWMSSVTCVKLRCSTEGWSVRHVSYIPVARHASHSLVHRKIAFLTHSVCHGLVKTPSAEAASSPVIKYST